MTIRDPGGSSFEVRWHGRGGQGTVTGAKSLAEAVQGTGKCVSAFPDYGPDESPRYKSGDFDKDGDVDLVDLAVHANPPGVAAGHQRRP